MFRAHKSLDAILKDSIVALIGTKTSLLQCYCLCKGGSPFSSLEYWYNGDRPRFFFQDKTGAAAPQYTDLWRGWVQYWISSMQILWPLYCSASGTFCKHSDGCLKFRHQLHALFLDSRRLQWPTKAQCMCNHLRTRRLTPVIYYTSTRWLGGSRRAPSWYGRPWPGLQVQRRERWQGVHRVSESSRRSPLI